MKKLTEQLLIIAGVTESTTAFAHNGDHSSLGFGSGLLHLISEPTHVYLVLSIVILLSILIYTILHQRH